MVAIKGQINFFMLLISSLVIGFATTMVSTRADSGYMVVKKTTGNNPNSAYHLISNSKNAYLWNSEHTKVKANLKHYKNYSWRYYDKSVVLSHNAKKSVYYYVQGITPNGNDSSKLQGIVWHGYLTPGVNPNYRQINNINFYYFNTDSEYLKYIKKSPSQKLTREVLKLFPNTQLSIQLTKVAGGASAWDFNSPTVDGYKDVLEFPTVQRYFNKRLYKRNISDGARLKLIKAGLDKSGYTQSKRNTLGNYQIGIYYYNNPHRLTDDEAPGFTIAIPE